MLRVSAFGSSDNSNCSKTYVILKSFINSLVVGLILTTPKLKGHM